MDAPARSASRDGLGWGLLAAVALLVLVRAGDLAGPLQEARASRAAIASDADFYRAAAVLGPEHGLVAALRERLAPGTPVAVEGAGPFTARRQRFWIALLPDHPIAADARWAICPRPCAGPGDAVVRRGHEFDLVRRGPPPASAP